MGATSQTVQYAGAAALALDKLSPQIADAISTGTKGLFFIKRKGNFKGVESGGAQLRIPIMYQLQTLKPLGAYGAVNVNPVNGDTNAYYAWGQTVAVIGFSDMEDFQMRGTESLETIVEAKRRQAENSLNQIVSQAMWQGQAAVDAASLATTLQGDAGATFIEPIGKLVHFTPSSSVTVGGIDQSANTWWRNQSADINATSTLADFLHQLRQSYSRCGFGGGMSPYPDHAICDPTTYNIYEKALALIARIPDYKKGDLPFDNVAFKGNPVVAEELIGDVKSGSTTLTYGTWYFLNSEYLGFTYDKQDSFRVGKSVRPIDQLAQAALMPVRGAFWTSNRRKLGVVGGITLSTLGSATA